MLGACGDGRCELSFREFHLLQSHLSSELTSPGAADADEAARASVADADEAARASPAAASAPAAAAASDVSAPAGEGEGVSSSLSSRAWRTLGGLLNANTVVVPAAAVATALPKAPARFGAARALSSGEVASYRTAFAAFDEDGSGAIDKDEMLRAVHGAGLDHVTARDVAALFSLVDASGDGELQLDEFLDAMSRLVEPPNDARDTAVGGSGVGVGVLGSLFGFFGAKPPLGGSASGGARASAGAAGRKARSPAPSSYPSSLAGGKGRSVSNPAARRWRRSASDATKTSPPAAGGSVVVEESGSVAPSSPRYAATYGMLQEQLVVDDAEIGDDDDDDDDNDDDDDDDDVATMNIPRSPPALPSPFSAHRSLLGSPPSPSRKLVTQRSPAAKARRGSAKRAKKSVRKGKTQQKGSNDDGTAFDDLLSAADVNADNVESDDSLSSLEEVRGPCAACGGGMATIRFFFVVART